jgi:formamidopyrimidine-DNA glycosylase
MPELPEVETVVRTIAPRLKGRRIVEVRVCSHKPWARSAAKANGQRVIGVRRYGKYILIALEHGMLAIHLGMTGRLSSGKQPGPYTRAILVLDRGRIIFDDIRQFGSVKWLNGEPDHLGPDALEISPEQFAERLAARRTRLKALLLDQSFVRGIGNIYADEALFRARINPMAIAANLSRARAIRLHAAIIEVLSEAIASGGSSVRDYVDADGKTGRFQFAHRVYQKTGQPCVTCGSSIRRILVAQRSTHFCPRCQRS